ncbi:hypothetical protein Syun_003440 [Stephania yunnanensis]|uniref:Uncharacterized protein n=1 Tax=Stephania yunnanensis TaxID=152371 RepID=A0AAP0L165_9MAGN
MREGAPARQVRRGAGAAELTGGELAEVGRTTRGQCGRRGSSVGDDAGGCGRRPRRGGGGLTVQDMRSAAAAAMAVEVVEKRERREKRERKCREREKKEKREKRERERERERELKKKERDKRERERERCIL